MNEDTEDFVMPPLLARWLAKTDRFWDYLLGRNNPTQANRKPRPIGVEQLEDRLVPDSRPFPYPVIAVGPGAGAGEVKLYDADTGAELLNLVPYQEIFRGGIRVGVGDFTHDGYPDVVTAAGAGGGPHVRIFDGKTGQQIPGPLGSFFAYDPGFRGGVQVAAGDVNGDGYTDLVTAADAGGGPHVKVFDGKTGATIASFFAFEPEFSGGVRLAVGDLTGDHKAELILAAGVGGAPRVRVLDATTLQPIPGPLGDFYAFDQSARGGVYVASGDITGGTHSDLVVGAGLGAAPVVKAFDGQTGAVILSATAFDDGYQGGVRVATAFVDQDSHADIVVGTGTGTAPRVRTLSGTTGQPVPGWAGDFDPKVGSPAAGVNIAAGNDPLAVTTIVTVEPTLVAVGEAVGARMTTTVSPGMDHLVETYHWQDGNPNSGNYNDYHFNPAVTSKISSNQQYSWTSPGTYAPFFTSSAFLLSDYGSDVATGDVIVTSLPPDEDSGCGCPDPTLVAEPAGGTGNTQPAKTGGGVRYDGTFTLPGIDLSSDGFDGAWGVNRSWSNNLAYSAGSNIGYGWVDAMQARLLELPSGLVLISGASCATYFDGQGTPDADGNYPSYLPRRAHQGSITFSSGEFTVDDGTGQELVFNGFDSKLPAGQQGALASRTDAGGNTTSVTSWNDLGQPTEVQRSGTMNGTAITESYLTDYYPDGNPNAGRQWHTTLRRQDSGGSWSTVREVEYTYYTPSEANGNPGDLKRAVVTDTSGNVLDQRYYRYYTGTGDHGVLKYALGAQAYDQLKAAAGGTDADVDVALDTTVAGYADQSLVYDTSGRVSQLTVSGQGCSVCSGGQGTYTYSYTTSTNADGFNSWKTKTVETLPDGSTNTLYTNAYGELILSSHEETGTGGTQDWNTYYRYDEGSGSGGGSGSGSSSSSSSGATGGGHLILEAHPSAVTGYNDAYADLVNYQSGNAQYLSDSSGLIDTYDYYTSTTATSTTAGGVTGFQQRHSIRQGETGTDIPQEDDTYYQVTANGATTTPVATDTVYRNADGTGGETTSYSYSWYFGTTQAYSITTTLPTVTTSQNGPGTAASSTVVYDTDGRPIWTKDADGFLNYTEYDTATGAVTKTITDVDTTQTSDFSNLPSGWATPTGGGLHLKALYEVDSLGRATKVTDPLGHVTYTVYDDLNHEVRTYAGWDATNHVPTGPTMVSREDRAGRYTETLTMSATPDVDGSGRPTGTEAISNIQSLSRSYANDAGQVIYTDDYFDLSGLTYSTSTTLGLEGTNFYRTRQDYDELGRPDRTVSPAGTITRTVYDGQGRVVSEWIGTDDTPTTGEWSPDNLAGTDMVKVREYEYDNGGVGDGNLTQVTEHPGLSADDRVTQTAYDWRDRAVAVKQGVQATEAADVNRPISYSEYDNLNEAISTELYDGDAVTLTTTAGVPDRPSASLLRAKTTTAYDEQGRAYQIDTYSVDPSTGAVSTYALTSNLWFDLRGNVIKTAAPGGLIQKTVYDGAGRATTVYTTDGGGDTAWSDAGNVTGDIVLEQAETQYDAASEPILTTTRQRFHDATSTGVLGTPSSGIPARVSYTAAYYDPAGRLTASVDVGTNGGTAYTRPSTVPARSDTVLITSQTYDAAGRVYDVTDPRGLITRTLYDALGRTTKSIENYIDGVPSDADDKTTEYGYGPAGMTSLTLDLTGGSVQTTAWVYGVTTAGGSAIASNDIVGETHWPDPTTGAASSSQKDVATVNALGQTATSTDRNGTAHTLTYDVLGRVTADAVTTLGSGVDGAVRRIETAYDGQGNPYLVTSYDAATAGNIVNQVKQDFNGLGQLTNDWQEHAGAVTGSSVRVQYAYTEMTGGANNSRQTSMTYPNGRVVNDNYATGLDDAISRLSSLSDSSATLEAYSYLGLGTIVERSHPQPGVDLTYIKQSGEANGDAGDQYTGLDRFGRVVDQRWIVASTGVATDRFQYGYDRDSNRTYRDNLVNSAFGELYSYDGLNQIASFQRGTLNSTKDGIAGTASRSQSWNYDAAGNFDAVTSDGTTQTRTANAQNEITSVSGATTPTFDANGNMTGDEAGKQFVYDAWNRLVAVKNSSGVTLETFSYDGLNRRISQTAGGTTTDLYYSDQWQVLEERVGGVATTQYVWSPAYVDALVERDRDTNGDGTLDERLYAQQDANWNTTALVSSSGNVVERYAYDAFGVATVYSPTYSVLSGSGYASTVLFQGYRQDQVTGNYYARMREYSPTLGRFLQVDPIGLKSDENVYRFVKDNPSSSLDPSGLLTIKVPLGQFTITQQVLFNGDSVWMHISFKPNSKTCPKCKSIKLVQAYRLTTLDGKDKDILGHDAWKNRTRSKSGWVLDGSTCSLETGCDIYYIRGYPTNLHNHPGSNDGVNPKDTAMLDIPGGLTNSIVYFQTCARCADDHSNVGGRYFGCINWGFKDVGGKITLMEITGANGPSVQFMDAVGAWNKYWNLE